MKKFIKPAEIDDQGTWFASRTQDPLTCLLPQDNAGKDIFWESPQYTQFGGLPLSHNKQMPAVDMGNLLPYSVSPTASECSSSLSTHEWSFYSGMSETSSLKGKSETPELAMAGVTGLSRFSLFNPGIIQLGALSMAPSVSYEDFNHPSGRQHSSFTHFESHRSSLCESIDCSGPLDGELQDVMMRERAAGSREDQTHLSEDFFIHEDWVSSCSEAPSWVCPSPDEATWKHRDSGGAATAGHHLDLPCMGLESREGRGVPSQDKSGECRMAQCTPPMVSEHPFERDKPPLPASLVTSVSTNADSLVANNQSRYSAAVKERFSSMSVHGFLRVTEQDGSLCYSLFLSDSDEVLFARACRQERGSNKENSDWIYVFHSRRDKGRGKGAWKGGTKREETTSGLVGHMNVSKARRSNAAAKEVYFVLYDGRGQRYPDSPRENEPQSVKQACDDRTSQVELLISKLEAASLIPTCKPSPVNMRPELMSGDRFRNCMKGCPATLANLRNARQPHCPDVTHGIAMHVPRQVELAAIVINTSSKEKKTIRSKVSMHMQHGWGAKFLEKDSGSGWGLRFLKKTADGITVPQTGTCTIPQLQWSNGVLSNNNQKQSTDRAVREILRDPYLDVPEKANSHKNGKNKKQMVDVTVVLPAGDHGWPMQNDDPDNGSPDGPTPLLERWQSGGDCDCGGWDMGCGLSVFKSEMITVHGKRASIALTRNDRLDWLSPGKPFKLFTQGHRRKVLVLEMMEAGLYSLSFQARFSPLQAFAVAVATFHQQVIHK